MVREAEALPDEEKAPSGSKAQATVMMDWNKCERGEIGSEKISFKNTNVPNVSPLLF